MGDETGLRPKAGRQREEPPDADWAGLVTGRTGHKRRKKAVGGFRGPHSPTAMDGRWMACLLSARGPLSPQSHRRAVPPTVRGTEQTSNGIRSRPGVCFLVARQWQWDNGQHALAEEKRKTNMRQPCCYIAKTAAVCEIGPLDDIATGISVDHRGPSLGLGNRTASIYYSLQAQQQIDAVST